MPWTRASELDRVLECQGALFLPHGERSERAQESAAWGTMVHHWKATGDILAVPGYEKHADQFRLRPKPSREALWPLDGRHEVSVAIDCLGKGVALYDGCGAQTHDEWKAARPHSWVTGTLDYYGELFGIPWVDDLKTGRFCPDPSQSAQFLFYGLAVYRLYPDPPDHLSLTVTHWPRYPKARPPQRKQALVTAEDLDLFEKGLRDAYEKHLALGGGRQWSGSVSGLKLEKSLTTGDHCLYCPSKGACPAMS